MFIQLFLLFTLAPIIEIAILLEVGEQIGGWNTLFLVIASALLGAHLVRQQGLFTLMQAQQKMQMGELPGQELAEGMLLVIAGVLLVTPGFITDVIGFTLCLPITRPLIAKGLMKKLSARVVAFERNPFEQHGNHQSQQSDFKQSDQKMTIDGEYQTVADEQLTPPKDPP